LLFVFRIHQHRQVKPEHHKALAGIVMQFPADSLTFLFLSA
jgi:hypothetical protein